MSGAKVDAIYWEELRSNTRPLLQKNLQAHPVGELEPNLERAKAWDRKIKGHKKQWS